MSKESLLTAIEEYKSQLNQLEFALQHANETEKAGLQQIQVDILELMELTLQQINAVPTEQDAAIETSSSNKPVDKLDEEFLLFKAEIAELDGDAKTDKKSDDEDSSDSSEQDSSDIDEELAEQKKKWEGKQVRAPFYESWGGFAYHNAIVLEYLPAEIDDERSQELVVLFNQPTSPPMVPCQWFLDGRCNFDAQECRFSHGYFVSVEKIQDYKIPDFSKIISGSRVLALHKKHDKIWHEGVVEDVLEDRSSFSVNCKKCGEVVEVELSQMVPLTQDELRYKRKNVERILTDSEEEQEEETETVPNTIFKVSSEPLGHWEKYTKGIGSKLMEQMGYVAGTGLGRSGEGRIDPVEAYVYPQGASLDRCMELREGTTGNNTIQVEKRLLKEQRKQEARAKINEQNLRSKTSVFDVINNKLGNSSKTSTQSSEGKQKIDVSKKGLQSTSVKDLNKQSFHISSQIKVVQKELDKLYDSKSRQANNLVAANSIGKRVSLKESELKMLKEAERKVSSEQKYRKDTKKLCVF